MYNSDLKTRFIRNYTESISTASSVKDMFDLIEPFEIKYGTDLYGMTVEQATEAISSTQSLRASSMEYRIAAIRSYIKWCDSNGVDGVNPDIALVEPRGFDHIRHIMIKDPTHLASVLNKIFVPISEKTIENIYRFYLWMYYSGMSEDQIFTCTKDDINYKRMEISVDGQSFPIYRESLDVVVFCSDAKEIAERHALMLDSRDMVNRYPGRELFRAARPSKNRNSARTVVTSYVLSAYNDGRTDVKITRKMLHLSGIFYRMYCREVDGFPVDFTEDALNEMKGKAYKVNKKFTIGVKQKRIMRDFEEDYANWKAAFNL